MKLLRASPISGASATISSVIDVSSTISSGIGISGFTKVLKESMISRFLIFTAPISVILQVINDKPVVSISKTIISSSNPGLFAPLIALEISFT